MTKNENWKQKLQVFKMKTLLTLYRYYSTEPYTYIQVGINSEIARGGR